jgi:hypothetical protein
VQVVPIKGLARKGHARSPLNGPKIYFNKGTKKRNGFKNQSNWGVSSPRRTGQHRADTAFGNGLNIPGIFTGTILNREHIGKTSDELVAKWNAEHPDDQVTITD